MVICETITDKFLGYCILHKIIRSSWIIVESNKIVKTHPAKRVKKYEPFYCKKK